MQLRSSVQLQQLSERHSLDGAEAFAVMVGKKLRGFLRAKALDHG